MALLTYSAKDVILTIDLGNGAVAIDGYADGSFVNVSYSEDLWGLGVGARGDGVRSATNNDSGEIVVRLMRNSPGNLYLGQCVNADKQDRSGKFKMFIKDNSTGVYHTSNEAWVQKRPGGDYQMDHQPIEWTIRCLKMETVYPESLAQNKME